MEPIVIFLICMAVVTVASTAWSVVYAIPQAKIRSKDPRIMTYRVSSIVVGALSTPLFASFAGICIYVGDSIGFFAIAFFGVFTLLGGYMLLRGLRWRLEARDECLLHRPTLGVTRRIRYDRITLVRISVGERTGMVKGYEIYAGKLRIKIGLLAEVYHLRNFKEYLTEQLTAHSSQAEVQIIEVGP